MMLVRGSTKMSLLGDDIKENPHFSEHQKTVLISVSLDGSKNSVVTTCF